MLNRHTLLVIAVAALSFTAGCYESTDTTEYEPGVYKGAADPLLDKMNGDKMEEQFAQRFQNQTDR